MDVRDAMRVGASRYEDVLLELRRLGLSGKFTQTGGMCAAIEVPLERGYLLVTDWCDSLPWDRELVEAWGVGYYRSQDVSEGPLAFAASENPDLSSLESAIVECIAEAKTALQA